ncbi:MAG: SGNH/GDSL hydrolase family protein [Actinomycetota bacterium]|nr:SGNH/GDSL hydrolase family protein [Actinomycetota bacterium]
MRSLEPPKWVTNVLLVLFGLAVAFGGYQVVSQDRSAHVSGSGLVSPTLPAASATPASGKHPLTAVFFGDSLVAGANAGQGNPTFADVAAKDLGWTQSPFGFPGSGFTTAGTFTGGRDYAARLEQLRGYTSDVIVIEGGLNDTKAPPALLKEKVTADFQEAHALVPGALLVLMGPWSSSGTPQPADASVNDALLSLANQLRIPYVDPIHEHWMTGTYPTSGSAATLISSDGFYPNAAGHAYFGHRLAADLRRLLPAALIAAA